MNTPAYAIGQAVFIRTDTPDYREETIPFKSLADMVELCSQGRPSMILEKVIVYSLVGGEPCALTLGFTSCTRGQRPGNLDYAEQ